SAIEAEGRAEAAKIRALGLAEAEKLEANGLARAKATEAQGLAEAAAIKEKAAAWREFNDAARLQTILEKLPSIIEASAPVFRAVAEPLGNIDKVVMIDNGGNGNGNGSGGINRFAQTAPTMIFTLLQQLQAMGLNLPDILAQLGIEQDDDKLVLAPQTESEKTVPKNEVENGRKI
ncbi:MAG: flotillin domain-containing protein, partial [Acidobacteriota bacterium]